MQDDNIVQMEIVGADPGRGITIVGFRFKNKDCKPPAELKFQEKGDQVYLLYEVETRLSRGWDALGYYHPEGEEVPEMEDANRKGHKEEEVFLVFLITSGGSFDKIPFGPMPKSKAMEKREKIFKEIKEIISESSNRKLEGWFEFKDLPLTTKVDSILAVYIVSPLSLQLTPEELAGSME